MRPVYASAPLLLLLAACSPAPPAASTAPAGPPETVAELIASDASWGNTEGPALDTKGNLYFTSRGTYKGVVKWNAKDGASRYLDIATGAGPGGLWLDDADNLYATATNERQVLKVTPDKKVSVVAKDFEKNPKTATGPNDLVVAKSGAVYFTDPNGYDGSSPNGTIYKIGTDGKTLLFSEEITGPNGILLSEDQRTLYVAHNTAPNTSKIEMWPLDEAGNAAGTRKELVTIEGCQADGMDVDKEGALWLTCYSYGTAYRVNKEGKITHKVTTAQKALTNCKFGRGADSHTLYLTSSDMNRVTGYVYKVTLPVGGTR
ncbi:MAG TPA: SMP-30/gluconolactonase/LRE family protein [Bryobacteraceae bacterium]|nr:SMP-30/gluconolactonase/LRE family protein [Bryobacteraceae bacterium]